MATDVQVQYRRRTAAQLATFTPALGEIIVDTTNHRLVVGDGVTVGGWPLPRMGDQATLALLGIGTAADSGNPLSVLANAALFNALGTGAGGTGDMRVKLNKAAAANTASFLFQDAFSGRAEIGLTTDDNFHFKVSPDGSTFNDAIILDAATGRASFPQCGAFSVQGRLTLTSATPVLSSTVTAAATVYWTPYGGNSVPLWNGAVFAPAAFAELSNVLANAATGNAGPAAAAASQVYDLYVWNNAGTLTLTRGPPWSAGTAGSNTVRGTGAGSAQQSRVNGILVNAVAIANGPAAGFGTYVGTVATDAGGGTVSWSLGGSAAGGNPAKLNVWNMYNRVNVTAQVLDSTASWTYATAAWRSADGSTGNRMSLVLGSAEETVNAYFSNEAVVSAGNNAFIGVALDGTGGPNGGLGYFYAPGSVQVSSVATAYFAMNGNAGAHFLQAVEYGSTGAVFGGANQSVFSLTVQGRF